MAKLPDQKQFWDAYGHAMGAAAGLELTMRIALVCAAAKQATENPAASIRQIQRMTFGQTAKSFLEAYPDFSTDEAFVFGLSNGVDFRNHLAHNFLEGRLDALKSEDGIRLVELECILATEHFGELERVVRARCPADFDGFFQEREGRAEAFVRGHPLRKHLAQIKEGQVPVNRGLDWWALDDEVRAKLEEAPSAEPNGIDTGRTAGGAEHLPAAPPQQPSPSENH